MSFYIRGLSHIPATGGDDKLQMLVDADVGIGIEIVKETPMMPWNLGVRSLLKAPLRPAKL